MTDTTKVWILGGIVTVIGFVLVFLAKWFFNEVVHILRDIREELKNLTHITTVQDVKIQNLENINTSNAQRLDRHSNRIMDIEKHIIAINDRIK